MTEHFELQRFVDAQRDAYDDALHELRAGRKRGHWMWFVLPQLQGLGSSPMARRFALSGLDEARAYADHPVLGPRLRECVAATLSPAGRDPHALFGTPDDLKYRSCLTLFAAAVPEEERFQRALDHCYGGVPDARTLALLAAR